MDALTAILGALALVLGLVLSGIALGNRVVRGVKAQVREVLIEVGLIRPGQAANWPNGWHNLPDAIEGLTKQMRE